MRQDAANVDFEEQIQFETVGQHGDRLGAALVFVHREPDRRRALSKQSAASVPRVLYDPASTSILSNEQVGIRGGRCMDIFLNQVTLLGCGRDDQ